MKKNYRFVLAGFLALVTLIILIIFKDVSSLNEKNFIIFLNIDQLNKRITTLEANNTIQQVSALKLENANMKKQIEALKKELKGEGSAPGNKGFLIRGGQPTP